MIQVRKQHEKRNAISLFLKGISQKNISKQLNVSEKTISGWLKELKEKYNKNQKDIKTLNLKLTDLLNNPNAKTTDIKNISIAIAKLENIWYRELIKI